jgi:benzylsuccinate CoA-transferase BbsF subunit
MIRPLEHIRILDFGHVVTGPFATGLLADFGADVIKVESATAVEGGRRLGPFKPDGPREQEGSTLFASLNRNKRSVAINLKHPQGAEVAIALAQQCDVLTENFSVGVMERLGLGPDRLRARNPQLIYVSMAGLGHTGPCAQWVSFNAVIQALSGLMLATGRAGDPPIGVSNSWADFMAGLHAAVIVTAALERRDHTGEGCWIDLSQYESNALPLGALMAEAQGNGGPARQSNRSAHRVPQGCYRCAGDDEWCVISVGSATEWEALVRIVGDGVLDDARYQTLEGRRAAAEDIDRRLETWTLGRDARMVERVFQVAGVPAAAVRTNVGALADLATYAPLTQVITHPAIGEMPMLSNPIHIEGVPARLDHAGPLLGQHTDEVLRQVVGMSDAEIAGLKASGALQ